MRHPQQTDDVPPSESSYAGLLLMVAAFAMSLSVCSAVASLVVLS